MPEPNPFYPGSDDLEQDSPPAVLEWSAQTRSGSKKTINDDAWLAFASNLAGARMLELNGSQSLSDHDLIFAVSDGMGGGNAGDVASHLLLEKLSAIIPKTFKTAAAGLHPDYLNQLEEAIVATHEAVNAKAQKNIDHQGMAATLALTWFTPENLYLANVGDSRVYLHRDGETRMLTIDHTFAWKKLNRNEINERQFRHHPRKSVLYQVIGGGRQRVKPNIAAFAYQPGDRFLICSDGLIDGLWEKHIHSGFLNNPSSTSQLSSSLMERAATNDGLDDITLITIAVKKSENQDD